MSPGLTRLFRPQSVAVIGGGAWCRSVLGSLARMSFAGSVWHVHPTDDGAIRDIADLPAAPDACFIGVNRNATIAAVQALAAMGAGGAVCFASGFAEAEDGQGLDAALLAAAGEMALVGPNCYGFVNALDGVALWPDVHGLVPVDKGVAILTQSSNIALNLTMQMRGLPIAFLGTAGNQAQIGLSQMARHVLQDARVTALGLHVEGVGDIGALRELMITARQLGKPVVALKAGRSDAAQIAALSHTASLAGSDAGATALFERLGILRVHSLDALIEVLKHAHLYGAVEPGPLASLSCSGGEASLMADGAEARSLAFAPLTQDQDAALASVLGPLVTRANPLDYHTFIWDDLERMTEVYATMARGPAALTVIVVDFPRSDRCQTDAWSAVIEAARAASAIAGKPVALMASLPESLSEDLCMDLMASGILPLNGLEAGLDALAAIYVRDVPSDLEKELVVPRMTQDARMLNEAEAKSALRGVGADTPENAVARSAQDAGSRSERLLPVALKTLGVAHKSDQGGVVLNLATTVDVEKSATQMGDGPFYLEEMVTDAVAELLVSVLADPAHGYVLTLGAGGVLTELWQDTTHLLVPAGDREINRALDRLRIAPLLAGYRGKPGVDRATLLAAIHAIQAYVVAQEGRVAEVEVNPLIVTPTRAVVADALIRGDV